MHGNDGGPTDNGRLFNALAESGGNAGRSSVLTDFPPPVSCSSKTRGRPGREVIFHHPGSPHQQHPMILESHQALESSVPNISILETTTSVVFCSVGPRGCPVWWWPSTERLLGPSGGLSSCLSHTPRTRAASSFSCPPMESSRYIDVLLEASDDGPYPTSRWLYSSLLRRTKGL